MTHSSASPSRQLRTVPDDCKYFGAALRDETATIIANPGPNEQKWTVHQQVVRAEFKYFDKAFGSPFIESASKTIELRDVHGGVLEAVLYWLYHRILPGQDSGYAGCDDLMLYLVKVWTLADRLDIPRLQNHAIVALCDLMRDDEPFGVDVIFEIYENTAEGSMLRKLACHEVAHFVVTPTSPSLQEYRKCFEELEGFGFQVCEVVKEIQNYALIGVAPDESFPPREFRVAD